MTSSSIDFKNLSINHACRAIFEITKPIAHLPNQIHEVNEFMNKINPKCKIEFNYNVIHNIGLKMSHGNINGIIICLEKNKIDIDLYDCDYAVLHGMFISYLCINDVPNSPYQCLHLISDTGVFMYRGEIKVHPIK